MVVQKTTNDTIAAIATPPGTGGIGIVRISGPLALSIFQRLFVPHRPIAEFQSHKLYYGQITDPDNKVLDEVLGTYMKAPLTYTREDVVEIHSHGSFLVLEAVLRALFSCGARPAEPGEFTKRAFLAGRIDLTRAEAVIDLLQAQTKGGAQLAVGHLQGKLFEKIASIQKGLVNILAVVEVAIDFPDEDVEILDTQSLLKQLQETVVVPLQELLLLAQRGKIIREGVSAVIAGRPNVGKSSLLNAMLQEERALVTEIPGTTRDTIEEIISINGIPVRLVDTAGIRDDAERVEELGIARARKKLEQADFVLFLLDGTQPLSTEDLQIYKAVRQSDTVVVINKIDIAEEDKVLGLAQNFQEDTVFAVSAREHEGLEELQDAIYKKIIGDSSGLTKETDWCAPNVRHKTCLEQTLQACKSLADSLQSGVTADLAAIELQSALDYLGDIVGLTTPDDILDKIFAEFCIGK